MPDAFLETQKIAMEAQITAINAALLFLYDNPHKSYDLNTGQGSQKVTREDTASLNTQLDVLLDRRSTLQTRCDGATLQIIPGF